MVQGRFAKLVNSKLNMMFPLRRKTNGGWFKTIIEIKNINSGLSTPASSLPMFASCAHAHARASVFQENVFVSHLVSTRLT